MASLVGVAPGLRGGSRGRGVGGSRTSRHGSRRRARRGAARDARPGRDQDGTASSISSKARAAAVAAARGASRHPAPPCLPEGNLICPPSPMLWPPAAPGPPALPLGLGARRAGPAGPAGCGARVPTSPFLAPFCGEGKKIKKPNKNKKNLRGTFCSAVAWLPHQRNGTEICVYLYTRASLKINKNVGDREAEGAMQSVGLGLHRAGLLSGQVVQVVALGCGRPP